MTPSLQRPALLILFLGASLSGCADIGVGLVALDLEIAALSADGEPLTNAEVWLEDHGLPWGTDAAKRLHLLCTTDRTGKCNGKVQYTYTVRRWPWQEVRTGPIPGDRFELMIQRRDHVDSLGFLPPLRSDQLHGAIPLSFTDSVENRR
jgi:hypothetical protein